MKRKKFICDPTLPYHVYSRCINKEWFDCPLEDVWKIFTQHLRFATFAYQIKIHAFVLMGNHYHMIVRAPHANLSEAMMFVLREVSRDILHNSQRVNRTFADRFGRSRLDNTHYYLTAYKYVYRNPVRAQVVTRAEEYPFSTLPSLLGQQAADLAVYDSTFLADPSECLRWLNSAPNSDDEKDIRLALRKNIFKFPKNTNAKKHPLENILV